ncbi:MAG: bifunctional 4-hydroxy-2-oxoglutarate aldolase/2-dehydro-3-deoxy-phosphogluconate aldolase [Bacteroidota bacterium]
MTHFSEDLFQAVPVIGILRGYHLEQVLKIAEIYQQVGFTNLEITMNTPDVAKMIQTLTQKYEGQLNIGAGTVCNEKDLAVAVRAGAQFIVSPITDVNLIKKCVAMQLPIFPGAFTPTEIHQAWSAGARMVKLFPMTLGLDYLKAVVAPLDNVEIMPTGGVNAKNIHTYIKAGAKAFGMGGALFDKKRIAANDWAGITQQLENMLSIIQSEKF